MNYSHELFEIETTVLVLVKFIAAFDHTMVHYDGKKYGPYEKGELAELPLWIAEQANKSHSVKYLPPRWLRLQYFKAALNDEKDTEVISSYFSDVVINTVANKLLNTTKANLANKTNLSNNANTILPTIPTGSSATETMNMSLSTLMKKTDTNKTNLASTTINNTLNGTTTNFEGNDDLRTSELNISSTSYNLSNEMDIKKNRLPMITSVEYQKTSVSDWWIILTKRLLKYFAEYETREGIIFIKEDMRDTSIKNARATQKTYSDDKKVVMDVVGLASLNDILRQIENIRAAKLKKMMVTPPGTGVIEERDNMFKIATGMTKLESSHYLNGVKEFWRNQFYAYETSKEIEVLITQ